MSSWVAFESTNWVTMHDANIMFICIFCISKFVLRQWQKRYTSEIATRIIKTDTSKEQRNELEVS